MTQTDLLFNPDTDDPSRAHKDENSAAAHEKIKSGKKADRLKAFIFIHESGRQGRTLEQVAWALGKPPSAVSGRLTELAAQGMIHRKEEKGQTTSGCACAIWIA